MNIRLSLRIKEHTVQYRNLTYFIKYRNQTFVTFSHVDPSNPQLSKEKKGDKSEHESHN